MPTFESIEDELDYFKEMVLNGLRCGLLTASAAPCWSDANIRGRRQKFLQRGRSICARTGPISSP
jgi:hypothetical protein